MNETVARYNFPDAAVRSALLRTAQSGQQHLALFDSETGTFIVVQVAS